MKKAILGRKIGMTEIFKEDGTVIPVTIIEAGPCVVVQKKTTDNDGYDAIQVGFMDVKESKLNKPLKGHFKKANVPFKKYLREFRIPNAPYNVGDEIKVDIFSVGEKVDVTGISKGKGFAGTIKRWNARRGPMAHGSKHHRKVGSLGASTFPARVLKGHHLPGRLGGERVTVQNLEIVRIYPEKNLMLVKGSVPGNKGSLLMIKDTVKVSK